MWDCFLSVIRRTSGVSCSQEGVRGLSVYHRCLVLGVVFAIAAESFVIAQDAGFTKPPTIEQIRAGYDQSVASLDSWWVKYRTVPKDSNGPYTECEWAYDGNRSLFRSVLHWPGNPDRQSYVCTDGKTTWVFDEIFPSQGDRRITERPFVPEDIGRFWEGESKPYNTEERAFTSTLGMRFEISKHVISRETLSTLLKKGGKVVGEELIEGVPCWHVDFGEIDSPGSVFKAGAEAWFDPAVGWWPR